MKKQQAEIRPAAAARALGVELNYIYMLLRAGKLEGRKGGRHWFVSGEAVEERRKRLARARAEQTAAA